MTSTVKTACLLLLACTPVPPEPAGPDSCGADRYAALLGQPRDAVEAADFDQPVRVIAPGDAVTMDFSPNRINFALDAAGQVMRITCG